jgi:hypothetical protein
VSWDIDFLSGPNINRVIYHHTDSIGNNLLAINRGDDVLYYFNLTSMSPFTSTMSTSTPSDLSGATVSCSIEIRIQNTAADNVAMLALNGKLYIYESCFESGGRALLKAVAIITSVERTQYYIAPLENNLFPFA